MLFARLAKVSVTLMISMVMAVVMMVWLWYYVPHWFSWVQDGADLIEGVIVAIPMADRYNNIIRLFASDDKIVLLLFVIIARVILALVGSLFTAIFPDRRIKVRASSLFGRISSMVATLFLAFVLAILMLAVIALTMESVLHAMLNMADWVENQISALPLGGRWRAAVRYMVSDDKLVLLFFTIVARILIALVATSFGSASRSVTGSPKYRLKAPA